VNLEDVVIKDEHVSEGMDRNEDSDDTAIEYEVSVVEIAGNIEHDSAC
jgi:hypothetical protein